MTAAEFLDWDGGGHVGKLELVEGEVRAMSPASATHGIIQANIAYLIGHHLRQHRPGCRIGTETPISPRLHANDNVRAPDLAVTCAPPTSDKRFPDPILIVDVMSPSNQKETWDSILTLASLTSLIEILVVDSERINAQIFCRDADGSWPIPGQQLVVTAGSVRVECLGLDLPLAEVYAGTHLVA